MELGVPEDHEAMSMVDVIVVAAGESSRMNGIDKRLVPLAGRPLLARTLDAFAASSVVERVILVMNPGPALDAMQPFIPTVVAATVAGGRHRGASVEAGLVALAGLSPGGLDPDRVVLVHDGARPLVSPSLIASVAVAATEHGAAMPVVPVVDTVRRIRAGVVAETMDRTDLVAVQTPQGVRAGLLLDAYRRYPSNGADHFSDEAGLLAACTIPVHPIPGDPVNLKVTVPADLARADAAMASRRPVRVGLGTDSHPFGPGEPLHLGGLEIPGAPRLHGHSDGDVAIHAIADGMLGGAALGDLGRLFPADRSTPTGIDSRDLLAEVGRQIAAAGWEIATVDLTITAARPRLAPYLDAMQSSLAKLLQIPASAVGVKASTGNLDGPAGAGRSIEAIASVSLVERWAASPPETVPA